MTFNNTADMSESSCTLQARDRFSLLLLEEGEYYFTDYTCHCHPTRTGHRVSGHLKLCSASIFFVPRNVHEPIFRVPYRFTKVIDRCTSEQRPAHALEGEEYFLVSSSQRIDMKMGNRNVPYVCHKGEFSFCFSLVFASIDVVLDRARELFDISKGPVEERWSKLSVVIKQHEDSVSFNHGWLEDDMEDLALELVANKVTPLVSHPGRVVVTNARVYFQPFNVVSSSPLQTFQLDRVISVMLREFNLDPIGLEMFFSERESVYFTFKSEAQRTRFHQVLLQQPGLCLQRMKTQAKWTRDWVRRKVSNFDYLMFLNRMADRSFNDLTQYPVFPWVIKDFTSAELDLRSPATFRDLGKPIGALNPKRLELYKKRYKEMLEVMEGLEEDNPMRTPPFLFGCHYSTPGYVVFYLLRKDPQLMLRLQNGRFDMADRLLCSISETFASVYSNPTDLKELTPEFYSFPPSFLTNSEGLDFGVKQSGESVGDVLLPPWAKNPHDFIHQMREALESPHVSRHLNRWIDLTFGYKQRGPAAIAADNVFHYLTYDDLGREQLENVRDPALKRAIKLQMMEFGRTPKQLFENAHPQRSTAAPPMPSPLSAFGSCCFWNEKGGSGNESQVLLRRNVRKVCNGTGPERVAAMEWIILESKEREPEAMELSDYTEVLPLVQMCRLSKVDMQRIAVKTLHALAVTRHNKLLILNAGTLEPLVDILCGATAQNTEMAVHLLARLVDVDSPLLASFNMSALAALVEMLHESTDAVRTAAASAIARLASSEVNRFNVLRLGGLSPIINLLQVRHSSTIRRLAATACMAICIDDDSKYQLVELGGLQLLIEICESPDPPLQVAAVQCIAMLSTNDRLKLEVAARGALRLLSAAACAGDGELQQAAAEAVANMCNDTSIINVVVKEEGLWSVIAMAQSPHSNVQRHAARAFWHLSVYHDNKRQIMDMGGLQSLLQLSLLGERNVQATLLAEEALSKLSEDPVVKAAIQQEQVQLG